MFSVKPSRTKGCNSRTTCWLYIRTGDLSEAYSSLSPHLEVTDTEKLLKKKKSSIKSSRNEIL